MEIQEYNYSKSSTNAQGLELQFVDFLKLVEAVLVLLDSNIILLENNRAILIKNQYHKFTINLDVID